MIRVKSLRQLKGKSKSKLTRKTYNELYYEKAGEAKCATTVYGADKNPKMVHIRLAGTISNVPALKNQKIQGTNILRPNAKVVLDLMTRAFEKSVNFNIPRYDEDVFVLIECAYRRNSFDEDNVLTTVRDWMEPQHIRGKDRGWGVGIVPNDRLVSGFAVKKAKTDKDADITEVYIRPLETIQHKYYAYIDYLKRPPE